MLTIARPLEQAGRTSLGGGEGDSSNNGGENGNLHYDFCSRFVKGL